MRFASFEQILKQSRGFQANEASDVTDHVNQSSSDSVLSCEMCCF